MKKKQNSKLNQKASARVWSSDPLETATDLYLIILLGAFPLFPGFSGYAGITLPKFLFFLTATLLWLVTLALLLILKKLGFPRLHPMQFIGLAFLAVCILSAACSPHFLESLLGAGRYGGLLTLALYTAVFLGVSLFTRPKPMHLYALAVSTTLCCLVAALQIFGKNPLRLFPAGLGYADAGSRYSGVYLGTIGNMNLTDAFLCMAIPLFFVVLIRSRRFWAAVPLVSALAIILAAGGSGAAVALTVTALAAMLLLPKRRPWRLGFGAAALVILIGWLLVLWFWPGQSGTAYEFSRLLHGHVEDSFGSSRILIWRKCLELFPQRPLLGGGPDTLPLRLDIQFTRFVPETGVTLKSFVDNAHNVYLGYLINCGALGLAAYLMLPLGCCIRLLRARKRGWEALLLAILCGAVQAFFGLGLCLTEPVFFALLGLSACAKEDMPA